MVVIICFALMFVLIIRCEKEDELKPFNETVTDIDGNLYPAIKIGDQWWMAENLRTTKYRNGDPIATTAHRVSILGASEPKYQWSYVGNEGLALIYGKLYTWYAATDSRGICPTGWHLPSDSEWTKMTDYLIANGYGNGGKGEAIGKSLAAPSGWLLYGVLGTIGKDQESNNITGFTALPAGIRQADGYCLWAGADCYFWSSTESNPSMAYHRLLDYWLSHVGRGAYDKNTGLTVRCIKDNPTIMTGW